MTTALYDKYYTTRFWDQRWQQHYMINITLPDSGIKDDNSIMGSKMTTTLYDKYYTTRFWDQRWQQHYMINITLPDSGIKDDNSIIW